MKIIEIIQYLEDFAPLALQNDFDNSGIQVGNINLEVKGILICLDVTEKVIKEAIKKQCNLVISHHPLLFKPLKNLIGQTYIEKCIITACKKNITIYSAHTNLDNVREGINYYIARKMKLKKIDLLKPTNKNLLKLVVYAPIEYANIIRNALFCAGAGQIGNYDFCSFNSLGEGTFCGKEQTNPFIGEKGKFHKKKEMKIETIFPEYIKKKIITALHNFHPYETPAYDIFPLLNTENNIIAGSGIIGNLSTGESEISFLKKIKIIFRLKILKHSFLIGKPIRKVAFCSGSGSFLLQDAIKKKADIFITGEARHNNYIDAASNKIVLAVIGHYESEQNTKDFFFDILSKKKSNFIIHLSETDNNPIKYI